jgi:flagellar motor switch protein FliN/FliY
MSDDVNQDLLAEQWAAALEDQDDDPMTDISDLGGGSSQNMSQNEALAEEWAAALASEEQEEIKKEKEQSALSNKAHEAEFKDLTEDAKAIRPESGKHELDFILDIPLDVSAELGRTRLLINELLQLGQGSVVELNKLAGEPLEIFVNGKLVARGEAVVINEKFGVRLTDIISPIERVKQLA